MPFLHLFYFLFLLFFLSISSRDYDLIQGCVLYFSIALKTGPAMPFVSLLRVTLRLVSILAKNKLNTSVLLQLSEVISSPLTNVANFFNISDIFFSLFFVDWLKDSFPCFDFFVFICSMFWKWFFSLDFTIIAFLSVLVMNEASFALNLFWWALPYQGLPEASVELSAVELILPN